MAKAYAFLCSEDALDLGKVLGMVDEVGAAGVKGMRLLDHGEQVWLRERLLAGEGGGGAGGGGGWGVGCVCVCVGLPALCQLPCWRHSPLRSLNPRPTSPSRPAGHTSKFGHPEPTQVRITPKKGKAVLISGHDLQVRLGAGWVGAPGSAYAAAPPHDADVSS